jgi:hypothetical protein
LAAVSASLSVREKEEEDEEDAFWGVDTKVLLCSVEDLAINGIVFCKDLFRRFAFQCLGNLFLYKRNERSSQIPTNPRPGGEVTNWWIKWMGK